MSSNSIYPHVPYFYVIEHITTDKKYAGCRYAKGCHPSEFMTEGGYCTSSKLVKKIIEEEGLDSFVVVEIKTIDEVGDVYEYETKFLTENECAASDQWLNQHNNIGMSLGMEEFKSAMLAKHGVENASQSEEVREKSRQTCLKNHGVEYPGQSEDVQEKSRRTCLKNHGVEYPMQSEVIREKSKQTCLDRYGYENPMQSEEVQEKYSQACLKNHGVYHNMQSEEVQEKYRQSMLTKHGVENPMQSEEVQEKCRQTMLKNHGVENYAQTKEHGERMTKLNCERFDLKIDNEILNGDFSRFVYLYDTIEHIFLMGVAKSLNRGIETKRYITIRANRSYQKYVDVLTGTPYKIDCSKFSKELPANFKLSRDIH